MDLVIKQADEEQRLVFAEVYAPNKLDTDKEFMTAVEIQKAAHKFLIDGKVFKVDVQHNQQESGAYIVESFIAWEGQDLFIPGSWVVGVKIPDDGIWQAVKSGEINGFSFQAYVVPQTKTVTLDIPNPLKGKSSSVDGHEHTYEVWFDDETGDFLGGETSVDDGHYHVIKGGTITEASENHWHTFESIFDVILEDLDEN